MRSELRVRMLGSLMRFGRLGCIIMLNTGPGYLRDEEILTHTKGCYVVLLLYLKRLVKYRCLHHVHCSWAEER